MLFMQTRKTIIITRKLINIIYNKHARVPQSTKSDTNSWLQWLNPHGKVSKERQHCQSHAQRTGMRTRTVMPMWNASRTQKIASVLYLGTSRDSRATEERFREVERRHHVDLPCGRNEPRR